MPGQAIQLPVLCHITHASELTCSMSTSLGGSSFAHACFLDWLMWSVSHQLRNSYPPLHSRLFPSPPVSKPAYSLFTGCSKPLTSQHMASCSPSSPWGYPWWLSEPTCTAEPLEQTGGQLCGKPTQLLQTSLAPRSTSGRKQEQASLPRPPARWLCCTASEPAINIQNVKPPQPNFFALRAFFHAGLRPTLCSTWCTSCRSVLSPCWCVQNCVGAGLCRTRQVH